MCLCGIAFFIWEIYFNFCKFIFILFKKKSKIAKEAVLFRRYKLTYFKIILVNNSAIIRNKLKYWVKFRRLTVHVESVGFGKPWTTVPCPHQKAIFILYFTNYRTWLRSGSVTCLLLFVISKINNLINKVISLAHILVNLFESRKKKLERITN